MASHKTLDQSFSKDWEKAVAWAQTQGVGANAIKSVFNYDSQRVATGSYPMSIAERNHALLAAQNPNKVTQVPSDKPNARSFLGNARADLGNIFTGLAPNHLIPNLFHTAETAIAHPSTWVKPIEEVTQGALSGNVKEVKTGLEGAGTSILGTVVPGVYVLSELAKGGVGEVLSHPITSFLDVAPFAPAGRVLALAADSERITTMATKLGMTPDELMKASVPKMGASFVMSRDIAKFVPNDQGIMVPVPRFPGLGNLTKNVLVAPSLDKATGRITFKPLSVSGMFNQWAQQFSGSLRSQALLGGAVFDSRTMGLDADLYTTRPFAEALTKIHNDPEKMGAFMALADDTKPYAPGQMPADIMAKSEIDPEVLHAYGTYQDMQAMTRSRTAASGGLLPLSGPTIDLGNGKTTRYTDYVGLQGGHDGMVSSSRTFLGSFQRFLEILAPTSQAASDLEQLRIAGNPIQSELDQSLAQARGIRTGEATPERGGARLDVDTNIARLTAEDGIVARALEASQDMDRIGGTGAPKPKDYAAAVGLSEIALDSLSRYGHGMVSAEANPALGALKHSLTQYRDWAKRMDESHQKFVDAFIGSHDHANEAALRAKGLLPERLKGRMARRPLQPESKDPKAWAVYRQKLNAMHQQQARLRTARKVRTEQRWTIKKALGKAVKDYREFERQWWDHPGDKWRSVLYDKFIDGILESENRAHWTAGLDESLRSRGMGKEFIAQIHSDDRRLAQAIFHETNLAMHSSAGHVPLIDEEEWLGIVRNATDEVNNLRQQGYDVNYVPVASSLDAPIEEGRYGAGIRYSATIRELSGTKKRNMTQFVPERHDLLLSIHTAAKEAIERDLTIEFASEHIMPHALDAGQVSEWAHRAFPAEFANLDPSIANYEDKVAEIVARRLGLQKWDSTGHMGFSFPSWQGKNIYIPAGRAKAIESLLGHRQSFAMDGVLDKTTNIFRTSILGLSPRYTAHIVFGGMFLLALRSGTGTFKSLLNGDAYRMVKEGRMPIHLRQGAAERGSEFIQYPTVEAALTEHAKASGSDLAKHVTSETMDRNGWDRANPIKWVQAVAHVNFKFTNFVSSMYRSAAYLDGAGKAGRSTFYDDAGHEITMTPERAKEEVIKHALKVMGDLKAMTPLERSVFTRIMPFYGWTRHILQYVTTYPVDHPYRAQFLAVQANLDSDSVSKALSTRIQFLFNLGTPDASGSVKAVDVRFLDPLRDTANYASWQGWMGALNPVLEAPIAMIDPNLVYGSTSLYPNVTYNQLYGIETSATQGNALLTGAEQVVSQVGALDAAFNLSGKYRDLATRNPNQFAKTIFQSLNIPFAQVQNINYKQLAAKGEDARFQVAKTAAANAWKQPGMGGTGIEKALRGYGSVPNPLNVDAGDITPAQLQQIYNAALAAYPGQNPADVIAAPPNAPGY